MNALCPIVWAVVAAAQGTGSTTVPAVPVEIVLVGAEPARREMQAAIQTVLTADPALSWSERDVAPGDLLSTPLGSGQRRQIRIDLADSSRARIVVPARQPSLFAAVRMVEPPAASEAGHQAVFRETVAQVVSALVRAMRDDASAGSRPESKTSLPSSSPPERERSRPTGIRRELSPPKPDSAPPRRPVEGSASRLMRAPTRRRFCSESRATTATGSVYPHHWSCAGRRGGHCWLCGRPES